MVLFLYDLYHDSEKMIIIQSPVKITDSAVAEIKKILKIKNIPDDYGLRIGIRNPEKDSASHILGFDSKTGNDNEYVVEGIPVFIDKSEIRYLTGITLDYYNGPDTAGFTFRSNR